MKKKNKGSYRNPQDTIDDTYNSRDFDILEKDMNSYVMPLDMMKDVDYIEPRRFYGDSLDKEIKNNKRD